MHIWRNQLAEATCKENGIHGSDHSYMPHQQPTCKPVLMNRLSQSTQGTIAAWVRPVIPESKTIWPDSALDDGLM